MAEQDTRTHGQRAYESYYAATNWKSIITGDSLLSWGDTRQALREAWEQAGSAVVDGLIRQGVVRAR